MTDLQIYNTTLHIRMLAKSDRIMIIRDNSKFSDWKNRLVSLLSDIVVRNHLTCLQPFQFVRDYGASGVFVYSVNMYHFNIYLKVNIKTNELVSFHYDEDPAFYKQLRIGDSPLESHPLTIIEDTSKHFSEKLISLAVGSMIVQDVVHSLYTEEGLPTISYEQYKYILDTRIRNVHYELFRRLAKIDSKIIDSFELNTTDFNLLTYDDTDKDLQLISFCYALWLNRYKDQLWLKDLALDALLRLPEEIQQQFMSQLYKKDDKFIAMTEQFEDTRGKDSLI